MSRAEYGKQLKSRNECAWAKSLGHQLPDFGLRQLKNITNIAVNASASKKVAKTRAIGSKKLEIEEIVEKTKCQKNDFTHSIIRKQG